MAALVRKITRNGNSRDIILPQMLLEMLGWDVDGEVTLEIVEGQKLVVSPCKSRQATPEEFAKAKKRVFSEYRTLNKNLAKR